MIQDSHKITKIKALILDMDGVLWRGNQPIGDLQGIFARIDRMGYNVVLATNNATLSTAQYIDKLSNFAVKLNPEQIVNSSQATAHYLARMHPSGGAVYIVGEDGLTKTLSEYGFRSLDVNLDELETLSEPVLAVVVAMDRHATYEKLAIATRLIRAGIPFLGTNPDCTFPTPQGLIPGAGAILAAIEAASDVAPIIVGKPSPEMYRLALERMQVAPEETLVVGDRLETDIIGGQQLGCLTALVLSGVTSPERASRWQPAPDWIAVDLSNLLDILSRN